MSSADALTDDPLAEALPLYDDDGDDSADIAGDSQVIDPEVWGLTLNDSSVKFYEHQRIRVDPGQSLVRVDVFLANRIKHLSRSRIKNAADAGFLRINMQPVKVSQKVHPYDEVAIILPYPKLPSLVPQEIPLRIVYEDDDLLVIDKAPGMVCHPGNGNYDGTLVNALLWHFEQLQHQMPDGVEPFRPGLVHRIDKDTSGLLVVAKNERAFASLSKQFFERTTQRNYYALVWGNLKQDQGTIVGNIGRMPNDRLRFMVFEDGSSGKHAVTHYQVLQRFGFCTLVRCKLETGRTHQIRVHFKYIGNTLFNDKFYGGNRVLKGKPSRAFMRFIEDCFHALPRQALHAKTLGFQHPTKDKYLYLISPLPTDFQAVLLKLAEFLQVPPHPEALGEVQTEPEKDFWLPGASINKANMEVIVAPSQPYPPLPSQYFNLSDVDVIL
jgi:23S rRNA pseudouridine1911/1915/1917 synthase